MLEHKNLFHVDGELMGYEIHMGETIFDGHNSIKPFAKITERAGKAVNILDGCVSADGNVVGTYIHGVFDNDGFRRKLIDYLRVKKGFKPTNGCNSDFKAIKERKYNELADIIRGNMDMNMIYNMLKLS